MRNKNHWDWLHVILIAFALAFVIRMYLFAPVLVDGESMVPTLQDEDRLIVNKFQYHVKTPERFDVIVFHATEGKDYIKRVIGLPGDHIVYQNDQLYINDMPVQEPFLDALKVLTDEPLTEDFIVQEVPAHHLFVLGDNRRISKDSRIIGPINEKAVVGEAQLVFWPFSSFHFTP
ncbi:signal peptidase I [Aureibacillus halotolerans]|uniref:Signal peptidase I n=1 Tax=Aureibacillus halotolerans TaxID=1508390 RepID=A0A4R6UCC2_9BACI|nr:signal peptidase I [Aureibacillus halotolerans]TDQ42405.1 type I signal peptidase [Aureibacillus halotolerans]